MKILVIGAKGFIGRHVCAALRERGHHVVAGVSRATDPAQDEVVVDFVQDTIEAAWLPRLAGIDAVVNAVGVLRDTAKRPMQAIHTDAPVALFKACAQAGVRRIVHVSALGIAGQTNAYASTKLAAERALLDLTTAGQLDGVVLRPSIVFGPGGDSSQLFLGLSRLPMLVLPKPVIRTRVQPVHVLELAQAVVHLLSTPHTHTMMDLVGPEPVGMADFVASLRQQRGQSAAWVMPLPDWATRLSAQVGDWLPMGPWGTQALDLLSHDNVGDAQLLEQLLGRPATHHRDFLATLPGGA